MPHGGMPGLTWEGQCPMPGGDATAPRRSGEASAPQHLPTTTAMTTHTQASFILRSVHAAFFMSLASGRNSRQADEEE